MKLISRRSHVRQALAGLSLGVAIGALTAGEAQAQDWSGLAPVFQGVLDAAASQDNSSGLSIAIDGNGGANTWFGSAGHADLEKTRPITPDTQFRIGSASKTVTGTVILGLVERGAINLDAPINTYVADLNVPNGNVITVRNLLSMTSGLPDYLGSRSMRDPALSILQEWANFQSPTGAYGNADYTPEQLVSAVVGGLGGGTQKAGAIGVMSYSNTNFALLGIIAQRTSGQDMEALTQDLVFGPLGLTNSILPIDNRFTSSNYAASNQYLLTKSPYTVPAGSVFNMTFVDPRVPWATGAMLSTPAEELRLIRELATNSRNLLSAQSQAQRLDFQYKGSVSSMPSAYGLAAIETGSVGSGSNLIGHSGLIAGYITSLYYNPDIDVSYAINLLGYQAQAAYWFPYFGAQDWYAPFGYQAGGYTTVPILWALDRNISLALSAGGACGSGGAQSGVTCVGDNVRTSTLAASGTTLTIEPSNRTIGGFYIDPDLYFGGQINASLKRVELPRPSLATFGSNISAIALEGDATLHITRNATVELWGENSSVVSLTGGRNNAVVAGTINTYGNRSYALLAKGSDNRAIVESTGSVLGSIRLDGQRNSVFIHGKATGGVELAGLDSSVEVAGRVASPAAALIPSAVLTYQLGEKPIPNGATDQAVAIEGASNRFAIAPTGAVDGRISIGGQGNTIDIRGNLTSADAYLRNYIAAEIAGGTPTPQFVIPAATSTAIEVAGTGNRVTIARGGVVSGTARIDGSNNALQMNGGMAGLLAVSGAGNSANVGGSLVADISSSSFALLASGAGNGLTIETSGKVLGNASVTGNNRIQVDGLVIGALEIADGARLSGNGMVDGTVGGRGGIVAPGNSVGLLTVGNYVARNNTLQIESDPFGRSDHLLVTHVADLDHGNLEVQPPAGATSRIDTVLSAGSVQGRFGSVSFSSPGQRAGLGVRYAPNAVQVATISPFQQDAAMHLGTDDTLRSLDILERRASRRQSGSAPSVSARHAGQGGGIAQQGVAEWLSSAPTSSAPTNSAVWVQAHGGYSRIQSDKGVPGIRSTGGGVIAGIDGEIAPNALLGIAGGYSHGTSDASAVFSPSFRSDTYSAGLYGSYELGQTLLSGTFFIGRGDDKVTQTYWTGLGGIAIAVPTTAGFNDLRTAGRVAASTVFNLGGFDLTPRAAVSLLNINLDNYTERGAMPGMQARWHGGDFTLLRPELTVALQKRRDPSATGLSRWLSGEIEVGVARDSVLQKARSTVVMQDFSPITVQGFDADVWALIVGARMRAEATDQVSLFASYNGSFSTTKNSQSLQGGLEIRF